MGLQRPSEPFHRVYSEPEPPAPVLGPRVLKPLAAVAALAAAGTVAFLVVPGGSGRGAEDAAALGQVPGRTSEESASSPRIVRRLPAPCEAVSKATVDRTVPGATRRQSGNSTLTTCTFSSGGSWLRVEAHLYAPDNTATPVRDAETSYAEKWSQAHAVPLARTVSLQRHRGVGEEAYRWFKADDGRAAVIGQVTARTRNAVLTVSYSERVPGEGTRLARERACLDRATAVAREVVGALNHF
ncbi:hypothetical protein ACN3XK_51920 [Actinomadura welshii]